MTYLTNIPIPTDDLDVSVTQIQQNFLSANTSFFKDHFTFNDATAQNGMHKQVTLTNVASPSIANANLVLYSAVAGGQSALWAKNSTQDLPLFTGTALGAINGRSSIYGGIIIQWGRGTTNGSGDATITFSPAFTTFFSSTLTRIETGGNDRGFVQFTSTPTNTTGTVKMRNSGGAGIAGSFMWMAIGN